VFAPPDLKATYAISVRPAPADWQVVSVSPTPIPIRSRDGVPGGAFEPTPGLSSVRHRARRGALPRRAIRGRPRRPDDPARCLLPPLPGAAPRRRRGLRGDRGRGFEFFERLFDYPYPFTKYDQLFVPEFNAGRDGERRLRDDPRGLRLPLSRARRVHRAARRDDPARARAHVVRRPGHHAVVGRPVAQRVVRDLRERAVPGRGHQVAAGLDDVRQRREDLGLPPGPAALDATRSSPTSPTSRTSRSTSTASPTPRAPRCSSSSSPGSAARSSSRASAATSAPTSGATPPSPTCSAKLGGDLRPDLQRVVAAVARDGGRQHVAAPTSPQTRTAGSRPSPSCQETPAGPSGPPLAPARDRPVRAPRQLLRARRPVELDVSGKRTDVPKLVGRARPDLVLLNEDDLTYAKMRLDERSLRAVLDGIGTSPSRCPARCAGRRPGT
jgi:aminopeptidase N